MNRAISVAPASAIAIVLAMGCVHYDTVADVYARHDAANRAKAEDISNHYVINDYSFFGISMFASMDTSAMILRKEFGGVGSIWDFATSSKSDFPLRSVELDAYGRVVQIVAIQPCDSQGDARTLASSVHDAL